VEPFRRYPSAQLKLVRWARFLQTYLRYYLTRTDLHFDQAAALAAVNREPKAEHACGSNAGMISEVIAWGGRASGLAVLLLACSSAPPPMPTISDARRERSDVTLPVVETCARYPVNGGSVALCNLELPGSFRVKNESPNQLEALSRVEVELEDQDGSWRSTDALVYLDPLCRPEPPPHRCATLEPRAVVEPHAWSGFSCSGQCRPRCLGNHYMRGWWLRFVVSTCDGVGRFAGPPFRLLEYEDVPL
jgi:hypothetical protein